MNRSLASPSSDSSNRSELYAALNCYTDYIDITLEELNFVCYFNESALIMSSELSDKPGKTVVTSPSIGNPGGSRFYYVCASYYEPNGEKCCMKLLYGETKEPNWSAILLYGCNSVFKDVVDMWV
ncbi:hypothetical protein ACFE04_019534 [Oxalis oulophora]